MRDIARNMAVFMLANPTDVEAIKIFTQFLENCIGSQMLGSPVIKQWRTVVNEYLNRISNLRERDLSHNEWPRLGRVLEELDRAGYDGTLDRAGYCYYYAGKPQKAVDCWERCRATQKREYYLAKAEVLGLPAGLEWLAKLPTAEAADRILEEWEKVGGLAGATDRRWLEYVGPALERKERHWEAFQVYLRLGDREKLLQCFGEASVSLSPSDLWAGLVSLVHYLAQQELWADVLDILERYFPAVVGRDEEKFRLRCDVVRELADSGSTPDERFRQRYEKFIDQVLSAPDWQQHLSVQEVGTALELIGGHISTLQFYQRFTSDPDPELQKFARERWIVMKAKQIEYFKQRNDPKAQDAYRDLSKQAHDWGMEVKLALPQFQAIDFLRLIGLPLYPSPERRRDIDIHGLPPGTRVERLAEGGVRFQIGGRIEVRIVRSKKRVLLTDEDLTTLLIDLERGAVSGQADVNLQTSAGGRLSFEVPASGYKGEAFCGGEKSRLELRIQGVSEPLFLEF